MLPSKLQQAKKPEDREFLELRKGITALSCSLQRRPQLRYN
jgi:hypothetical protein